MKCVCNKKKIKKFSKKRIFKRSTVHPVNFTDVDDKDTQYTTTCSDSFVEKNNANEYKNFMTTSTEWLTSTDHQILNNEIENNEIENLEVQRREEENTSSTILEDIGYQQKCIFEQDCSDLVTERMETGSTCTDDLMQLKAAKVVTHSVNSLATNDFQYTSFNSLSTVTAADEHTIEKHSLNTWAHVHDIDESIKTAIAKQQTKELTPPSSKSSSTLSSLSDKYLAFKSFRTRLSYDNSFSAGCKNIIQNIRKIAIKNNRQTHKKMTDYYNISLMNSNKNNCSDANNKVNKTKLKETSEEDILQSSEVNSDEMEMKDTSIWVNNANCKKKPYLNTTDSPSTDTSNSFLMHPDTTKIKFESCSFSDSRNKYNEDSKDAVRSFSNDEPGKLLIDENQLEQLEENMRGYMKQREDILGAADFRNLKGVKHPVMLNKSTKIYDLRNHVYSIRNASHVGKLSASFYYCR